MVLHSISHPTFTILRDLSFLHHAVRTCKDSSFGKEERAESAESLALWVAARSALSNALAAPELVIKEDVTESWSNTPEQFWPPRASTASA